VLICAKKGICDDPHESPLPEVVRVENIKFLLLKLVISNVLSVCTSIVVSEWRLRKMLRTKLSSEWKNFSESVYAILRPYIYPQLIRFAIVWKDDLWDREWPLAFERMLPLLKTKEHFLSSSELSYLDNMMVRREQLTEEDKRWFTKFCGRLLRSYMQIRREMEKTIRKQRLEWVWEYYWQEYRTLAHDPQLPNHAVKLLGRILFGKLVDIFVNLPLGIATLIYIAWNVYLIVR